MSGSFAILPGLVSFLLLVFLFRVGRLYELGSRVEPRWKFEISRRFGFHFEAISFLFSVPCSSLGCCCCELNSSVALSISSGSISLWYTSQSVLKLCVCVCGGVLFMTNLYKTLIPTLGIIGEWSEFKS